MRGGTVIEARSRLVIGVVVGLCAGVAATVWVGRPAVGEAPLQAGPLEGLWEVTAVRNITRSIDEPLRREFHLFSKSHQMVVLAGEGRPRLDKSFSDMTPEEIASQQPVGAGFYHFTVSGDKIVRTNILALSAHYEGRAFPGVFRVGGDTLVLRDSHSADGDEREWTMRRVVPQ